MFVAGRRKLEGTRTQYLVCQSWGPTMPSGPLTDDQPEFSFWVDARTIAGMLAQDDSFAFSRFQGFAGRALPKRWRFSGFANPAKAPAMPTPRATLRIREDAAPERRQPRRAA
jgi:hypothetical protein